MKKFLSIFVLALVAFAATAAQFTVYEDNSTSTYVPLYGKYLDTKGTRVQVIYPESALADIVGLPINSVKFYITNNGGNPLSGGKVDVLVGTTDQTQFPSSGTAPITGLTHVAYITMTQGETELLINFENPFVYAGGNLVIETAVEEETADYTDIYFAGKYEYGSYNAVTYTYSWARQSFYPKATFDYTPAEYAAVVTPNALDFGRLYPEQAAELTFTVKNRGANAFTPAFSGIAAPFTVAPEPAEIASGESVEYTVTFAPTALGEYNGTLAIDCGAAGQFQIALSGAQVEVPAEVVVAQGEATNKLVPVDPENYEHVGGGAFSQMIYPAEMLTDLAGKKLTGIRFHTTQAMTLNGGNIQLSLKEVEEDAFAAKTPITGMTVVANGAPVAGTTELVFEFTEPYEYAGGNLAVEARVTTNGNYSFQDAYLGVVRENAAYAYYYNFGFEDALVNFLPMATISYEKGETPVEEWDLGDVNHDHSVDVNDVTMMISYILGNDPEPFYLTEANVDGDAEGAIDVNDVTAVIAIILNAE